MKDSQKIIQECIQSFFDSHPELSGMSNNIMMDVLIQEKRTYSVVAITYAIKYMQEQFALEKATDGSR